MKKLFWSLAAVCLLLAGCARPAPEKAADGADWNESWTTLGNILGVEEPGNDLVLRDNKDALSVTDMYLATWTIGDGESYCNEDEEEVVLYPARLDVLVYGRRDADEAQSTLAAWTARQAETYAVSSTSTAAHSGQDYTISAYACISESNPYSRGISAFSVYRDYAISVELNCQSDFPGDEAAILRGFLDSCHYAA